MMCGVAYDRIVAVLLTLGGQGSGVGVQGKESSHFPCRRTEPMRFTSMKSLSFSLSEPPTSTLFTSRPGPRQSPPETITCRPQRDGADRSIGAVECRSPFPSLPFPFSLADSNAVLKADRSFDRRGDPLDARDDVVHQLQVVRDRDVVGREPLHRRIEE